MGPWQMVEDNKKCFKNTINTIANGISVSRFWREKVGIDLIHREK